MAEASQHLWSPNEIFSDKHPKTDAGYVALKYVKKMMHEMTLLWLRPPYPPIYTLPTEFSQTY